MVVEKELREQRGVGVRMMSLMEDIVKMKEEMDMDMVCEYRKGDNKIKSLEFESHIDLTL